jgi:hypothetical protein
MPAALRDPTSLASAIRIIQSLQGSRNEWKFKNSERRIESKRLREVLRDHQARTKSLKIKCKEQTNTLASKEHELQISTAKLQKKEAENANLTRELEQVKKKLQPKSWFHRKSKSVVEDIVTPFS